MLNCPTCKPSNIACPKHCPAWIKAEILKAKQLKAEAAQRRKMRRELVVAVCAVVALNGCASRPLVDPASTDMAQYERDYQECKALTADMAGAGTGAAVGAAAGWALARILAPRGWRDSFGNRGAVVGGVSGAGAGAHKEAAALRTCLRGRGHNPLD